MSEMPAGICFILHADLRFGVSLEIVMLGFQASQRNLLHRRPSSLFVYEGKSVGGAGQRSFLSLECYAANVRLLRFSAFQKKNKGERCV